MNKFIIKAAFAITIAMIVGVGCAKKEDAPPAESSSGSETPPLTAAQLGGSHASPCIVISGGTQGTDMDGNSYIRTLNFSGNNYSISVLLFTGATCNSGGTQILAYSQGGTFSIATTLAASGASQILFTSGTAFLSIYGASVPGSTWAGHFNTYCPGGPTDFNTGATSVRAMAGVTCNHLSGPGFTFEFPANGTEFYDVVTLDSVDSPSVLTTSTPLGITLLGQYSSFPTTANFTYTRY